MTWNVTHIPWGTPEYERVRSQKRRASHPDIWRAYHRETERKRRRRLKTNPEYIKKTRGWRKVARERVSNDPTRLAHRRKQAREWRTARHAENRAFFLRQLRSRCAVCGYSEHPEILEFDHIDATKKTAGFGTLLYTRNLTRAWKEFENIQLLCPNHHTLKTLNDGLYHCGITPIQRVRA